MEEDLLAWQAVISAPIEGGQRFIAEAHICYLDKYYANRLEHHLSLGRRQTYPGRELFFTVITQTVQVKDNLWVQYCRLSGDDLNQISH